MTVKKLVLAALGATFLVGAAAPASFAAPGRPERHGPGPDRGMMEDVMFVRLLKEADTNRDGKISKDELMAWGDKLFAEIDTNKDGVLTPGELRKFQEARMDAWREKHRAEHEGRGHGPHGPDMANGDTPPAPPPGDAPRGPDGKDGPGEMADKDGPRHGPRDEMRHGKRHAMERGMMPMMALVRMIDTDENGQISKAEATEALNKLFDRMDRNKDGLITVDDLPDRPL
ncbi:EF-hand domain-containing protein [Rhizobium straminoryzae]|uniref:EF-hand domain-containing protein n=1 Tax=Rhizobium straminoryzae TaxID=1387186 RepID=A0A549TH05_9HYPH|nr:EF-hand domain-containing protein [Rhizobium straminoryzae]TRL42137.1 EF-hand domain-containing protein [Rhizobium straminoryzae]